MLFKYLNCCMMRSYTKIWLNEIGFYWKIDYDNFMWKIDIIKGATVLLAISVTFGLLFYSRPIPVHDHPDHIIHSMNLSPQTLWHHEEERWQTVHSDHVSYEDKHWQAVHSDHVHIKEEHWWTLNSDHLQKVHSNHWWTVHSYRVNHDNEQLQIVYLDQVAHVSHIWRHDYERWTFQCSI